MVDRAVAGDLLQRAAIVKSRHHHQRHDQQPGCCQRTQPEPAPLAMPEPEVRSGRPDDRGRLLLEQQRQ
jgi:hypothetical protein